MIVEIKAKMYHVTSARHRESILKKGLVTDASGWDTGYVWLFSKINDAFKVLKGTWGHGCGGRLGNDLWSADIQNLNIIPDPHPGWEGIETFALAGNIDPTRLKLILTTSRT